MNRSDIINHEVNDILETGWFYNMIEKTCRDEKVKAALLGASGERMLESCMTIHHQLTSPANDDDDGQLDFAMA